MFTSLKNILTILFLTLPTLATAKEYEFSAEYTPLVNIPGVTDNVGLGEASFLDYVAAIYGILIVVAALIAVVRLVIAGARYMMTDLVSGKGKAIADIQGSLLGLLIIIAAVVILNTINPNLTQLSLNIEAENIEGVNVLDAIGLQWVDTVSPDAIDSVSCVVPKDNPGGAACNETACVGDWVQVDENNVGCVGSISTDTGTVQGGEVETPTYTLGASCTSIGCDEIWDVLDSNYGTGNYSNLSSQLEYPDINAFDNYTVDQVSDLNTQCTSLGGEGNLFTQNNTGNQYFMCIES